MTSYSSKLGRRLESAQLTATSAEVPLSPVTPARAPVRRAWLSGPWSYASASSASPLPRSITSRSAFTSGSQPSRPRSR